MTPLLFVFWLKNLAAALFSDVSFCLEWSKAAEEYLKICF